MSGRDLDLAELDEWLGDYYARDGRKIKFSEWASCRNERVAATAVGTTWVSTVWVGIAMNPRPKGRPLIFETMAFSDTDGDNENSLGDESLCERYATEAEALAGHAASVAFLQGGGKPEEYVR